MEWSACGARLSLDSGTPERQDVLGRKNTSGIFEVTGQPEGEGEKGMWRDEGGGRGGLHPIQQRKGGRAGGTCSSAASSSGHDGRRQARSGIAGGDDGLAQRLGSVAGNPNPSVRLVIPLAVRRDGTQALRLISLRLVPELLPFNVTRLPSFSDAHALTAHRLDLAATSCDAGESIERVVHSLAPRTCTVDVCGVGRRVEAQQAESHTRFGGLFSLLMPQHRADSSNGSSAPHSTVARKPCVNISARSTSQCSAVPVYLDLVRRIHIGTAYSIQKTQIGSSMCASAMCIPGAKPTKSSPPSPAISPTLSHAHVGALDLGALYIKFKASLPDSSK
ncbi:hypothetical protein B0H15DRAFT_957499 [Mycena belliarum]|uniref:Uncharacterized protein n=1 Tax=Mycena belliarum TaxID=1033014 RepID=A0AAD6TPZ7_9AGAR|nr:hypothetical protein B0H15DRAFT_957499 [Mycena belliae]